MAKIYDLVYPTGTYTDPQTGQEKASWTRCGAVIETSQGKRKVKLEAIPVEFNGWLECVLPKPKGQKQENIPEAKSTNAYKDFDDEIPDF